MGSYSSTKIDDLELWWSKSEVDEDSLSIFLERDRRVRPDPSQSPDDYDEDAEYLADLFEYAVSAKEMKERLDALGFTLSRAEEDHAECLRAECELQREWISEGSSLATRATLRTLKSATFERWQGAVARTVKRKIPLWNRERLLKTRDAKILRVDEDYAVFGTFSDRRLFLRALLEAVPSAKEVVLDITDLVHGGYFDPDDAVCANARANWSAMHPIYGTTVVLTEGRSDSRLLKAGMQKLLPHLVDLFGFLDFEGLRIEGSSGNLARIIRAFIGAGLSSRVIAIFDNDTAGAEAIDSLKGVQLPPNFRIMTLPRSEIAAAYPTTGPQGVVEMDVNGLAASIELFLGKDALTAGAGSLQPVRWTGWHDKLQRYQGSVERKGDIQSLFLELLEAAKSPSDARQQFPDLARVVDQIAFAFA